MKPSAGGNNVEADSSHSIPDAKIKCILSDFFPTSFVEDIKTSTTEIPNIKFYFATACYFEILFDNFKQLPMLNFITALRFPRNYNDSNFDHKWITLSILYHVDNHIRILLSRSNQSSSNFTNFRISTDALHKKLQVQ